MTKTPMALILMYEKEKFKKTYDTFFKTENVFFFVQNISFNLFYKQVRKM